MKERPPLRNSNVLYAQLIDFEALQVSCVCPHCSGHIVASFSHDIGRCPHCLKIVFWDDLLTPELLDSLNTALSYRNRENKKEQDHD